MGAAPSLGHSLTLAADVVRAMAADAAERGLPIDDFRDRFDVPLGLLEDADARVDVRVLIRLWERLPAHVNDPAYGLHLAERTRSLPLLARLFQASRTLGEGIDRLLAIQRLLNDVHTTTVVQTPRAVALRVRTKDSPLPVPSHAIDFAFAWMALAARRATGASLVPLRVAFEHARPKDVSEYRRIFGCMPAFDAEENELAVDPIALGLPLGSSDPELAALLERHAKILLDRLPGESTFASRVREALVPLLAEGPTLAGIAEALRVSERSAQRYLMREGTTFAALLDEVRCRRAEVLLHDGARSIGEISGMLGFADQSTFHRAFVRWKGATPGAYRRGVR